MSNFESLLLYIVVAIVSSSILSLYKLKNIIVRHISLVLSVLIPSVFAGIRYNVGTDYPNYFWTFEHLKGVNFNWILTDSLHFNMDRGFLLISKILSLIFSSKAIFGIWGFIILTFVVVTLYKQYHEYDIGLIYFLFLLLYYFSSFNILRQVVAASIVFYALKYVIDGKYIRFLVCVAVAASIHFSALLALPIWFLWNHKTNKSIGITKKWTVLLVAFLFVTLWQRILQYLAVYNIASITKYLGYLSGNDHSNTSFLVKLVLTYIFFTLQTNIQRDDEKIGFFILLFSIGMFIDYTGYYSSFVKRSGMYYSMGEVILFSRITCLFSDNSRAIAKGIIMILMIVYFTLSAFVLKQGGLIPFTF